MRMTAERDNPAVRRVLWDVGSQFAFARGTVLDQRENADRISPIPAKVNSRATSPTAATPTVSLSATTSVLLATTGAWLGEQEVARRRRYWS